MSSRPRFASLAAALSLALFAPHAIADEAPVDAPAGDGGAIRVLVHGALDPTAVAAQIAAELGVATTLVDDEADCAAPCAIVSRMDKRAAVHVIGASGGSMSRFIDLPDGPGAVEVVALVVGNLARDEAAVLLARMGGTASASGGAGASTGAGSAGGGPVDDPASLVPPASDAPVIVPAPAKAPRRAAARPEAPRDPETPARFSVGLIPPLSFGVDGPRGGGGLALDLIVGGHKRLAAFNVAGVGSIVTEEVKGTQIAGVGAGAGRVDGAQVGGVLTVSRDLRGAQIAGALAIGGRVEGVQVAGALAAAGDVDGTQVAGAAVTGGRVRGAQIAGALALAREVRGAQVAGSVAISAGMVHTQIAGAAAVAGGDAGAQVSGAAAIARGDVGTQVAGGAAIAGGNVRGAQIAPFNLARRVEGVQVGVVNVAGGGDGISIGLLNLVRGGRTELEATLDQRKLGALVLRHGSRRWHNVYGVAARAERELVDDQLADDDVWMYGLGLGPSWRSGRSTVDLEAMAWHVVYGQRFADDLDLLAQLRLVVGHPVGPAHLVVGGAVNTYITTDERRPSAFSSRLTVPAPSPDDDPAVRVELWPSVFVGVRI